MQRQEKSASTPTARAGHGANTGERGGRDWRGAARGVGFDEGEAMLSPGQEPGALSLKSFVHWVQSGLNAVDRSHHLLDAPLRVDGVVGKNTRKGVVAFQKGVRDVSPSEPALGVDGRVGPDTTGALERAVGVKNPEGREATPLAEGKVAEEAPAAPATKPAEPGAKTEQAAEEARNNRPAGEVGRKQAEPASAPTDASAAEREKSGGEAGGEVATVLPPNEAQETELAAKLAPSGEAGAKGAAGASEKAAAGSDADLAARLEKARAEIGLVREKKYRGVPPLLPARWAKKLEATLKRKHPGKPLKSIIVWYAADATSLARLEAYAKSVAMGSYSGFIAAHGGGYQWCGSFVGAHYQMGARMTAKHKGKRKSYRANSALASTTKSHAFFTYGGQWKGAWIRDPAAADDAPLSERYKPLTAYHDAHGGRRRWLPVSQWRANPSAVVKPGMVLFVKGDAVRGRHITFVDRVEADGKGGWIIHTVEGNGPKVATQANSYRLPKSGKTDVRAVARPAALDFDASVEMIDRATYADLAKKERG